MINKTIGFCLIILALSAMSCGQAGKQDAEKKRDGIFIHISHGSDNPHRLLMGLKMAMTMAEGGKDVLVYCDIEAVRVLTKTAPDVSFAEFPTLHELLTHLGHLNVTVMACPTCMKVANVEAGDLREGIMVAQRDRFFGFTAGRILSLDY